MYGRTEVSAFAELRGRYFGEHYEPGATIFHPAFLGMIEAGGSFLAVTDGDETLGRDALADKKIFCSFRALSAKSKIVFRRADVIAMPFNFDPDFRIGFHPLGIFFQNVLSFRFQFDAVKLVVYVFERRPGGSDCGDAAAYRFHSGRGMHRISHIAQGFRR